MWKETVVAYIELQSKNLRGETGENHKDIMIANLWVDIWSQDFRNV